MNRCLFYGFCFFVFGIKVSLKAFTFLPKSLKPSKTTKPTLFTTGRVNVEGHLRHVEGRFLLVKSLNASKTAQGRKPREECSYFTRRFFGC